MSLSERRHDIDWIRVIAIGLLLVYHVAIGFQPWGIMIGFIGNERPWQSLWVPMTLLNVWRIPLLFFVSGMGVYFALRNRTWSQLLQERAKRILLPFLFGIVTIVPIHIYLWQYHYHVDLNYTPGPGHLWFLGNLFSYVVILLPLFFFLKRQEGKPFAHWAANLLRTPLGLLPVFALFVAEVLILHPIPFELYAMTWHGFFLGLQAFFFGFFFVWCGRSFWNMLLRWWWLFLTTAIGLFIFRLVFFQPVAPAYLLSTESNCWILTVFALGYRYLNRPSKALSYLSKAAYPIYIVHMIFLYLGSLLIFPLRVSVPFQFILVLLFTIGGCFLVYELVIRRIRFLKPLFGLN
ncbi:acyltransferase family protein [Parapedobacter indicus]|uniref:Acyltransferase family protein n=1 Tax=Parapedobacter indicus TaxID=1477437 RepID=A0A1I3GSY8_9SPHI|nr:acyltransferase family protein [Parapedobacter indicus]PPL02769.1 acyltransferase-like protein [Parapedobacter indicus]SFI26510.1 Acyltransferase family protein [Parapedobacter indicus]